VEIFFLWIDTKSWNSVSSFVEKKDVKTVLEIRVFQVDVLLFLARVYNCIADFILRALR
jgi:hypothetical protein